MSDEFDEELEAVLRVQEPLPKKDVETTRTIEEIIAYYKQERAEDILGFEGEVLLPYLPSEQVKEFLEDGTDLSEWKQIPLDREAVLGEMKEYMSFAWDKVQDHRGISASRSVKKMQAWLWLLRDDETLAFAQNDSHYAQYGAPILKKICDVYEFPVPAGKDVESMVQGKKCSPGCAGCGSGWTVA